MKSIQIRVMPSKGGKREAVEVSASRFLVFFVKQAINHLAESPPPIDPNAGPPIWVSSGNEVELEIENTGRRAAQVLVEIKQKYTVLGARVLQLPPGRSTQRFPIKSPGLADYFAVTKPTADLRFRAIRLEHGSPNVAPPK